MATTHCTTSSRDHQPCLPHSPRQSKLQQNAVTAKKDIHDISKLKPYVHPPETKADLSWSELVTLDLADYDRHGGKERLAKQLEHAVHHVGFFYVKNYGLSQEEVDRQFTLA